MSDTTTSPLIRVLPFKFNGNATEFFKIWIVNVFLTIITLGIYSPWAKVRKLRYLYGNVYLDDNRFTYLADPVRILKGRIVAVTALVIYSISWNIYPDAGMALLVIGVFLLPFILVTATSFQMRNTGYRHVRFFFGRNYKEAYRQLALPLGIVLLITGLMYAAFDVSWMIPEEDIEEEIEFAKSDFLTVIFFMALMPVVPYLDYLRSRFIINHTQYGKVNAEFDGTIWKFYKIYIATLFMSMLAFIITMVVIFSVIFLNFSNKGEAGSELAEMNVSIIIGVMAIFYLFSFIVSAYLRAKRTNMIYEHTNIGESIGEMKIISCLKTWPISWLYTSNTVAIILSLGLLVPWAKIRMSKYVASCTEMESRSLDGIEVIKQVDRSALGEEMLDAFDMDLGL